MTNRCKNVFTISRGVAEPARLNTLALRPERAHIGIRGGVAGPALNMFHPAGRADGGRTMKPFLGPSCPQSEPAAPLGHAPSAASIRPRVATAAC